MNTFKKRILSGMLSAVTAAAMAVPAFAADESSSGAANTTIVNAAYSEQTVDVVVPSTVRAFINPYGMGVELRDSDGNPYNVMGKIMSEPMYIKNRSGLNLTVGANAKVEVKTTTASSSTISSSNLMSLATSSVAQSGTTKKAYVELQIVGTSAAGDEETVADLLTREFATDAKWDDAKTAVLKTASSGATNNGVDISATENDPITLAKANLSDGNFESYNSGSIAMARLSGDLNAKAAWSADDAFTVTILYTFAPAVEASGSQG